MWQSDLTPYHALGPECATCLSGVGWLERNRSFATGSVDRTVYDRLGELLRHPWEPAIVTAGFHVCDLCLYDGPQGRRNLYVPDKCGAFVCPELITHYMNAHGYRPPDEFCAAVLACPPMRSMRYLSALQTAASPLVNLALRHRQSAGQTPPDSPK